MNKFDRLADLGLTVIRCNGKRPVDQKWQQEDYKQPTPQQRARWEKEEYNVGIPTGERNGFIVVDCDDANAVQWAVDNLQPTPMKAKTRKGEHWYYRHPGEKTNGSVRMTIAGVTIMIDIRGDGNQVIGPGSKHPDDGSLYQEIGTWTPEILLAIPVFDKSKFPKGDTLAMSYWKKEGELAMIGERKLNASLWLNNQPKPQPGQGNTGFFKVSCQLCRGFGLTYRECFDLLKDWDLENDTQRNYQEFKQSLKSAIKTATDPLLGKFFFGGDYGKADFAELFLITNDFTEGSFLSLRFWKDKFYRYTGQKWEHYRTSDLKTEIIAWAQSVPYLRIKCTKNFATDVVTNLEGVTTLVCEDRPPFYLDGRRATGRLIPLLNGVLTVPSEAQRPAMVIPGGRIQEEFYSSFEDGSDLERFTLTDTSDGTLRYNGLHTIRAQATYADGEIEICEVKSGEVVNFKRPLSKGDSVGLVPAPKDSTHVTILPDVGRRTGGVDASVVKGENVRPLGKQSVNNVTGRGTPDWVLEKIDRELFNLNVMPFDYDPDAKCPIWMGIIEDAIPHLEKRLGLQMWFGLLLTGIVTYKKFMILHGESGTGKSVICTVMRALLGSDNFCRVGLKSFVEGDHRLVPMEGKLANIVEELEENCKFAEDMLKELTGGGSFTVNPKGLPSYSVKNSARQMFATNHLPKITDKSDAVWDRVIYIQFTKVVPPHLRRGEFLEEDFWVESGELSGIFNWALEGLKALFEAGGFPDAVQGMNPEIRGALEINYMKDFCEDYLEYCPDGGKLDRTAIYRMYQEYHKAEGGKPFGAPKFYAEIKRWDKRISLSAGATTLSKESGRLVRCILDCKLKNIDEEIRDF